jgi:acyl-coenzyme A thioesterase PaaI-like protein
LGALVVNTKASAEVLERLTADVDTISAALDAEPSASTLDAIGDGSYVADASLHVDRIAFIGHSNPISPPIEIDLGDRGAVGRCTLDHLYQGAPGIVHGGVVAALADQMCGAALVAAGHSGLTTLLEVRYVKPTPIGKELVFEAWLERVEGAVYYLAGECKAEDVVISRVRAEFARVDPEKFRAIVTRAAKG